MIYWRDIRLGLPVTWGTAGIRGRITATNPAYQTVTVQLTQDFTDALCKTRQIPEAGKPANGDLPPVPKRTEDDVDLDAEERIWTEWHQQHHQALRAAWERWWGDNKKTFKLD